LHSEIRIPDPLTPPLNDLSKDSAENREKRAAPAASPKWHKPKAFPKPRRPAFPQKHGYHDTTNDNQWNHRQGVPSGIQDA
jgi:hypothetical protein